MCRSWTSGATSRSLPSGGAWVEMRPSSAATPTQSCRSPQGERGLKFDRRDEVFARLGRSPQGERGLKSLNSLGIVQDNRRSPQGERGLKWHRRCDGLSSTPSLPSGGAWVEIVSWDTESRSSFGRSPQGERGLKSSSLASTARPPCRSPQGERGLKSYGALVRRVLLAVAPLRGSVG